MRSEWIQTELRLRKAYPRKAIWGNAPSDIKNKIKGD
jgi:hypothetical protein